MFSRKKKVLSYGFLLVISVYIFLFLYTQNLNIEMSFVSDLFTKDKYLQESVDDQSVLYDKVENVISDGKDQTTMSKEELAVDVAKYLKLAKLHARGLKTGNALNAAIHSLDRLLHEYGTSFKKSTQRKVYKSDSICPEHFVDLWHGFPLYQVGYEVENCSYSIPIYKIVTVVIIHDGKDTVQLQKLLSDLNKFYKNIKVFIGTTENLRNIEMDKNIYIFKYSSTTSKGQILNRLIGNVKSIYTLVARDVTQFDSDIRIERLVREIESLKAVAVGGSIRNSNGDWNLSCYQRVFRNYTVVFREGYDESMHDCVFCDHVDSPFLIKTAAALSVKFDEEIFPMGLYEDFFMRLPGEIAVCPDSMFNVDFPKHSDKVSDWKMFGRKRLLYKLKFSPGLSINFGCDYDYPCETIKGYVRSPCCIQELVDTNNYVMKVCEESGFICEFQCGTLLGALKMNKVLPWEVDGDIRLWHENFTAMNETAWKFRAKGYTFNMVRVPDPCEKGKNTERGYFHIKSKHWIVELYTFCDLDSYTLKSQQKPLTKLLHNGYAANVPRNPSLAARNRYPQFYSHVQHDSEDGVYNIHSFSKCFTTQRHDCLDHYRTDGNIQFDDPVP